MPGCHRPCAFVLPSRPHTPPAPSRCNGGLWLGGVHRSIGRGHRRRTGCGHPGRVSAVATPPMVRPSDLARRSQARESTRTLPLPAELSRDLASHCGALFVAPSFRISPRAAKDGGVSRLASGAERIGQRRAGRAFRAFRKSACDQAKDAFFYQPQRPSDFRYRQLDEAGSRGGALPHIAALEPVSRAAATATRACGFEHAGRCRVLENEDDRARDRYGRSGLAGRRSETPSPPFMR